MTKDDRISQTAWAAWATGAALAVGGVSGCMTSGAHNASALAITAASNAGTTATTTITTSYDSYVINNIVIASNASSTTGTTTTGTASPTYETQIYLNSSTSSPNLLSDCAAATSSTGTSSCTCQYTWTETNTTSGSAVIIPRQVITNIDNVQKYELSCPAPSVYGSDIQNGTSLNVTVLPATGGTVQASFNTYTYVVGQTSTVTTSNFTDSQATPFANIARYTCLEQTQRGMSLQSMTSTVTDSGSLALGTRTYPLANKFCLRNFAGTVPGKAANCLTLPAVGYSAQSYYFNLYIQQNAIGNINPGNNVFTCPLVKEALSNPSAAIGTQGKYWPLDTAFALSLSMTSNYSVSVEANMVTTNPSDPVSQAVSCAQMAGQTTPGSTATPANNANSLVTSCLGFAAPANSNGSCPVINGLQTYRLRRYYALYPPIFDTTGAGLGNPQQLDSIYVSDRPVTNPADPSAVITMTGPKPCPFSYFDKTGVTGATGYVGTSNANWNGTNVDGIQFPNVDSSNLNGTGVMSCATALPLVSAAQNELTVTTISSAHNPVSRGTFPGDPTRSLSTVYVRPTEAWAPHYVEDTAFLACAPLARPLVDPPLHFAKLTANPSALTYCAEVYPSQNDNLNALDPTNLGTISPFTSHTPLNSAITACEFQIANPPFGETIPIGYPAGGVGHHLAANANACNRTVLNPAGGITWPQFPLLAAPADVDATLEADSGYGCTINSYNGNPSSQLSPSQGCCGTNVAVTPGAAGNTSAHLEPTSNAATNCMVPNY
jgi:hypothetical protein